MPLQRLDQNKCCHLSGEEGLGRPSRYHGNLRQLSASLGNRSRRATKGTLDFLAASRRCSYVPRHLECDGKGGVFRSVTLHRFLELTHHRYLACKPTEHMNNTESALVSFERVSSLWTGGSNDC